MMSVGLRMYVYSLSSSITDTVCDCIDAFILLFLVACLIAVHSILIALLFGFLSSLFFVAEGKYVIIYSVCSGGRGA